MLRILVSPKQILVALLPALMFFGAFAVPGAAEDGVPLPPLESDDATGPMAQTAETWIELAPGTHTGQVRVDIHWATEFATSRQLIEIIAEEALGLQAPVSFEPVGREGVQRFVAMPTGDGPFRLRTVYEVTFEGSGRTVSTGASRVFYLEDESIVNGEPDVVGNELPAEATLREIAGDDDPPVHAQSHCFVSFTSRWRMSDSNQLDSRFHHRNLEFIRVEVYDENDNFLQAANTGSNGVASFSSVRQDPCGEDFYFLAVYKYWDGSSERVRMSPPSNNNWWITTTSQLQVSNNDAWVTTLSVGTSKIAYMFEQTVDSYRKVDGASHDPDLVRVHFQDGVDTPSGGSAYYQSDDIYMDGTVDRWENDRTLYHEYGHHVMYGLNDRTTGVAYGDHDCNGCHRWDSVHESLGSAFNEGWANFFSGVMRGQSNLGAGWDLNNPSSAKDDGNFDCWGPYRECSTAAALWDVYGLSSVSLFDMLDVLDRDPDDIHDFYREYIALGKSSQSSAASLIESHKIPPKGDADSWTDAGGSTSTAVPLAIGSEVGALTSDAHGSAASVDYDDYYRFSANSGQQIELSLIPQSGHDFDLYLYNPIGQLRASSTAGGDTTESITFTADVSGTWFARASKWQSAQGRYVIQLNVENGGGGDDLSSTTITSFPGSVSTGQPFTVCWSVQGSGSISHTNIHWRLGSGSEQFTSAQSGTAPSSFCDTITAPSSSGTITLYSHATGPNDDITSATRSISVNAPSGGDDLTWVELTSYPPRVLPGEFFTVCWTVHGSGSISHTDVHYSERLLSSGLITGSERSTDAQTGSAVGSFCDDIRAANTRVWDRIDIHAHAIGPNDDITSATATILLG